MSDTWDDYAKDWDTNPDAIKYSEKAFDCLVKIANFDGAEVFDLGCGTGLLTEKMATKAKSIVALDTSTKMIDVLNSKKLPNVITVCNSLSELLAED